MEALQTLGIDPKVLIAQIINFGILIAVLTKLLYKPILKVLDQRKKKIEESLVKADEIDKQHAASQEEAKKRRDEAKSEASQIISEAKTTANKDREQILLSAVSEADRVKDAAREQIEIERQAMAEDTKKQVGKLALFLLTRSLQQEVDGSFYEKNINKALKEIEAL